MCNKPNLFVFYLMKRKSPRQKYLSDSITCDPVGIQTQDLQNRNLTLYSAKLRDRNCFGAVAFIRNAGAKIRQKTQKRQIYGEIVCRFQRKCCLSCGNRDMKIMQFVSRNQEFVSFCKNIRPFCLQNIRICVSLHAI